jgi:hypothetical protein
MRSSFNVVAALVFAAIAVVHAYRLVSPFVVQIGSFVVPQSISWLGLVVAAALSVWGFRSRT